MALTIQAIIEDLQNMRLIAHREFVLSRYHSLELRQIVLKVIVNFPNQRQRSLLLQLLRKTIVLPGTGPVEMILESIRSIKLHEHRGIVVDHYPDEDIPLFLRKLVGYMIENDLRAILLSFLNETDPNNKAWPDQLKHQFKRPRAELTDGKNLETSIEEAHRKSAQLASKRLRHQDVDHSLCPQAPPLPSPTQYEQIVTTGSISQFEDSVERSLEDKHKRLRRYFN